MNLADILFDQFRTLPSELGFVRARELRRQAAELQRQADELEHRAALDLFEEIRPAVREVWERAIAEMQSRGATRNAQSATHKFDTPPPVK